MISNFSLASARTVTEYGERQWRIYKFLQAQHVGVLSTVTPDNNPHGAVVYYTIAKDFMVRILTKTGTKKYDNMMHNDHVLLTVYEPKTQTTAQIIGRATEHANRVEVDSVANDIFKPMVSTGANELPPIVKLQAGAYTTFQIKPSQIRMAVYSQPVSGDYDNIFESIESFELRATS